jgi:hypothetical protein
MRPPTSPVYGLLTVTEAHEPGMIVTICILRHTECQVKVSCSGSAGPFKADATR